MMTISARRCTPLALALLAACSGPAPESGGDNRLTSAGATEPAVDNVADAPSPAAPAGFDEQRYLGRWIGVEGMNLTVAKGAAPGAYALTMQWDLENKGSFTGRATDAGLAFERDGETLTLRPTDGDATGLKWLAGKKTCLTVRPSEGYCRD